MSASALLVALVEAVANAVDDRRCSPVMLARIYVQLAGGADGSGLACRAAGPEARSRVGRMPSRRGSGKRSTARL